MDKKVITLSIKKPNTTSTQQSQIDIQGSAPVLIKAAQDTRYILSYDGTEIISNNITSERQGNDLHVAFNGEDTSNSNLIIQDFFSVPAQLLFRENELEANTAGHDTSQTLAYRVISNSSARSGEETPDTQGSDSTQVNLEKGKFTPTDISVDPLSTAESNSQDIPVIGQITDDVGNVQGIINPGTSTNDTTPTASGIGEYGQTIHIYDNGSLIGSTAVRTNGTWSFTPTTPLLDGLHSITITATSDGTVSAHSAPYLIIIDTLAPDRPHIKSIYDDHGSQIGYYTDGSAISDAQPTIAGRGEVNSTVIIYDNGIEIAQVAVGSTGNWSFTPNRPLADGPHQITLKAVDAAENESPLSAAFNFTVDTQAPAKPSIDAVLDDQGQHASEIPFGGVTSDSTPLIIGIAEPNSLVTIMLNGVVWDVVLTDSNGKWTYTPDVPFSEGLHNLSVAATDQVGNTSETSDPFTFTVDSSGITISITSAVDNEGPYTGTITAGHPTDDATPTLKGTANANAVVKIYDGSILLGQTKANAIGAWTFTPENGLSEGRHHLTATVTVGGYESSHSNIFELNIDLTAPDNLGLVATDDAGKVIISGGITQETQPILSGRGEPNATITLTDNGEPLGETVVSENGQWLFVPDQPLTEGTHNIAVVITDKAGNSSAPSDIYEINIGSSTPSEPVILEIIDDFGASTGAIPQGGVTDDRRPTFVGTAKPGSDVFILSNPNQPAIFIGVAKADASGHWSFTPEYDLPLGDHAFYLQQGSSISDETWAVTLILPPLTVPTIDTVYETLETTNGIILNGDKTEDRTPLMLGKAEANSTVIIKNGDEVIGSVKANAQGHWSFTPSLNYGYYNLTAVSEDHTGRQSEPSEVFSLGVLTTITYDFESIAPGLYDKNSLPYVDGVLFKKPYGSTWYTKVMNVNGSKVGYAHSVGVIEVTWPEGSSAASFNIWSKYPTHSGAVTINFYMNGKIVEVQTLEHMPTNPNDSLIKLNLKSGTFDQIEIKHPAGEFLIDNITVVRGGNHAQAEEVIQPSDLAIDASNIAAAHAEPEPQIAAKHAPLQLSVADLLEDGDTSLYANDSKAPSNDDKRLELSDLEGDSELNELDTQATDTHISSDNTHQMASLPREMLAQSGLEIEPSNFV